MLWLKSWLETRWRLVAALGFLGLILFLAQPSRGASSPEEPSRLFNILPVLWMFFAVVLAGAGINTQSAFRATKGLHGSIYFTLTLPVSRLRLLAVRAGIGIVEMSGLIALGCFTVWTLFPLMRGQSTPFDRIEYVVAVVLCISGFYSFSVFLSTFLDDLWRTWISMGALFILRRLWTLTSPPPSLDIFRAMTDASPLITHALPWTAMGISIGVAGVFFLMALKVVETREY